MIESLRELFISYRWVEVYGPVILVTSLTYLFKVLAKLLKNKRWTWLDRSYFYLGMPLIWASFGRVLAYFIGNVYSVNPYEKLAEYMLFLTSWSVCALFVFVIHATYEMSDADLLEELRSVWRRDKKYAQRMKREFNDPEPTHKAVASLQRVNLMGVASGIGLATFAVFDYLFVGTLFPRR